MENIAYTIAPFPDEESSPDASASYVPILIKQENEPQPIQVLLPQKWLEDSNVALETILEKLGLDVSKTSLLENSCAEADVTSGPTEQHSVSVLNRPSEDSYTHDMPQDNTLQSTKSTVVDSFEQPDDTGRAEIDIAESSKGHPSTVVTGMIHLTETGTKPKTTSPTVSATKTQTHKVKIRHGDEETVVINVSVANSDFRKYIPQIGFNFSFVCKKCKYNAKTFDSLVTHMENKCSFRKLNGKTNRSSKPSNTDLQEKKKEHSYATKSGESNMNPNQDLFDAEESKNSSKTNGDKTSASSYVDEDNKDIKVEDGCESSKESANSSLNVAKLPREYFCVFCPYTLIHSEVEWKLHLECHNSPEDPNMTCCMCKSQAMASVKDTRNWSQIKAHLFKKHEVDFKISCKECDVVLTNHVALKEHMQTHIKYCSKCNYSSVSERDLEAHQECHDAIDPKCFCCLICGYRCKREPRKWSVMLAHLVAKHQGVLTSPYFCESCGKGFQGLRSFTEHCKICNTTVPMIGTAQTQCKICGSMVSISHFAGHVKKCTKANWNWLIKSMMLEGIIDVDSKTAPNITDSKLPESESTSEVDGSMTCEKTTSNVVSETDLIKLNPKNLKCLKHNLKFEEDEVLVQHFIQDHLITRNENKEQLQPMDDEDDRSPEIEMEVVDSAGNIINFEQSVEKDEPFTTNKIKHKSNVVKCVVCYKKFSSSARLHKHIEKVHTAEKLRPVECGICGKFFKTATRRRNHIREVHEMKRRRKVPEVNKGKTPPTHYICEECGYITPSKDRLKNHQLAVHLGVLPFQCNQCDYKTSERADLVRHKHKHSGVKKHSCKHCSYKTNERWVLVNHCLRQHDVHLPKLSRNTTGLPGSLRWQQAMERRKQLEQAKQEAEALQNAQASKVNQLHQPEVDTHIVDTLTFPNAAAVVSHLEELETEATVTDTQALSVNEVVVGMEPSSDQDIFYIQASELTEAEQAALMLVSVGPTSQEQEDETGQP